MYFIMLVCVYVCVCAVPDVQCTEVSSVNGGLRVGWRFLHTGGLNLSNVRVFYSVNGGHDKQQVTGREMGVDANGRPTSIEVGDVTAGWTYAFLVSSHNQLGESKAYCRLATPTEGK